MRRAAPAAAVALGLGLAVAACGGSEGREAGSLQWEHPPKLVKLGLLPSDRLMIGRLRNDSLRPVRLVAARDLRVVGADGHRITATAAFSAVPGHTLFSPDDLAREKLPEFELVRTGLVGRLEPGKALPITIAWRLKRGESRAARVEYPGGLLRIPSGG